MARIDFDRDGSIADAIPHNPASRTYRCFADRCPMPGTIFPGQLMGDKHGGTCAWHYGVEPLDIPKVTAVLRDWQCLAYEISECRRVHTSAESATSPKAQDQLFAAAVERLREQVKSGGWGDEFEPKRGERYARWGQRLEEFLGGKVVEVLSTRRRAAA
jgi:hypothetical protein